MSWKSLEEASPALAAQSFERLNRKIAYLATIKQDGSPRLHPVTPFIGDGMLFIFTEPSSPKIGDIQRNGHYALHCSVGGGGPLVEILVSGLAEVITDPGVRDQAADIAESPVVNEEYVLIEFQIERLLAVEYKDGKRAIRRWKK